MFSHLNLTRSLWLLSGYLIKGNVTCHRNECPCHTQSSHQSILPPKQKKVKKKPANVFLIPIPSSLYPTYHCSIQRSCFPSSWTRKALRIIRVLRRTRRCWLAGRWPSICSSSALPVQGLSLRWRWWWWCRSPHLGDRRSWPSCRGIGARSAIYAARPAVARHIHGGANCQVLGPGAEELTRSAIVDAEVKIHRCA